MVSDNVFSGEGFGLFPFRSPLLRKFLLVSFPPGTEMFHFPGCAPMQKHWCRGFTAAGFPIRTSPDHRLLGTSPKLIAAMPRPSSPLRVKASTVCPFFAFPHGKFEDRKRFFFCIPRLLRDAITTLFFCQRPFLPAKNPPCGGQRKSRREFLSPPFFLHARVFHRQVEVYTKRA